MKYAFLASAAAVLAFQSSAAIAQGNTDEQPEINDRDIVVTANRIESLASRTPIALTAVSGDGLANAGITNPTQLDELVPNLSIVRGNGLQITIRGVTSTDGTEKGDPSAAFNVNGVYIARPQAQEVSFFDIERVEVLRGPQGTLYGRNSTAGVVNLITARPRFELGGSLNFEYGNYNDVFATAVINVPASETLAFRMAGNIDRRDSYVRNFSGDGFDYDPYKENVAGRLSALWEPTSELSLLVIGDYADLKGSRINTVPTSNFFTGAAPVDPAGNATLPNKPVYVDSDSDEQRKTSTVQQWDPYNHNTELGLSAELNWNFGPATFTYLGSYRESTRDTRSTIIGGMNRATFAGDYWQTSHEARLAFGGEGPLSAQVGAYYFKEKSGIAFFILDPQSLGFPPIATQFGFPQDPTIAINQSAFGQATYEVMPDLRFTAGVRYSNDEKSRVGATVFDTDPAAMIPGNRVVLQVNDAARTFDKVTWRFGIDYDSPVGLLFASVSSGYKAGGFNDGCLTGPNAPPQCVYTEDELFYQPETITAYEAGAKFRFDALQLNVTGFHYDYSGLQLSQIGDFGGCGNCQLTTNAAGAKIDGIEIEGTLDAADGLLLRFGINYLDARYSNYSPSRVAGSDTITLDFSGRPLARSPEWTGNLGINYALELGNGGSLVFDAGTRFSSSYALTDIGNLIDYRQPSYTRTDASIRYNAPSGSWHLAAFIDNIEDEIVLTSAGYGNAGFDGTAAFADPRTFGVRAGIEF
ncbi:TonB-dependent receptor [Aurantiacibacter flavus]|uniref:TonB-dependent receptor n=1 Tax=Aurantiacibacter flavus TaxID=3145232 RepID=A0ABV0CSM8_9SPHN